MEFTKTPLLMWLLPTLLASPMAVAAEGDWPWWRGPSKNGHADPSQKLPAELSLDEHTLWEAPVPGKGHGSPIVVGDRVYLVSALEKEQSQVVLCYNRSNGTEIWRKEIHKGGFFQKINHKATHASTTPAWDGEKLYVSFMNSNAVWTTALTADGEQVWQKKITEYVVHQGYAASPTVYKDLLLISADNKKSGAICALNRSNGDLVWKVDRPKFPNYVSPVVCHLQGRDQAVFSGCEKILSLDPVTGKVLWEVAGSTQETVTSIVTDGELIFISGGWPKNHVHAIASDGSGKVVWKNITRVYVPSMLVKDGHLFAVMDGGSAVCWNCKTGERLWKGKLGGTFSSSPVLVGDHIHVINETGEYSVFKADPAKFEVVHRERIGDKVFATPAICGNQMFVRVAQYVAEQRVEKLYCLGARK